MNHSLTVEAAQAIDRQAAIESEIALLDWVIAEAQLAHESAKAHAAKREKPMPLTALRLVVQAHNRKMALLGLAPARRNTPRATAQQMAETLAQAREKLLGEMPAPQLAEVPTEPAITPEVPAAPYLNRAQRRALLRTKGKRKAA